MLKKLLIAAVIVTSSLGIATTSEAAQYDNENYYCGDYNDEQNYNGEYCGRGGYCYGGGRGCR